MSIQAGYLVAITPRTISAGASDLETNGMLLTKSALLPSGTPAMAFASAAAVAAFFGDASDEAVFAQQYFTGLTNQQKAPTSLVIGRRIDEDAPAWIRGGAISADLAAFKKVTDGAMKITIDGAEKTATAVDLSSATSLSEVVQTIATALTGCTGSYDSTTNTVTLTSSTDGASSTVSYASAGDDGTDLSAMLCMTQAEGAVLSQGVDAMTEAATLDAIRAVTANWAQFTTLWEVTEQDEAEAYAAWADIDDDYVYVFWSSDRNMESTLTQDSTIAKALQDKYMQQTRLRQVRQNGDLQLSGEITNYDAYNKGVGSDGYSTMAELRMTVNVRFVNNSNHAEDITDQQFSASREYNSSQQLSSVQEELVTQMIDEIVEQIFNATVANW